MEGSGREFFTVNAKGPFVVIAGHPDGAEIGGGVVEANLGGFAGLVQAGKIILKINPVGGTDSFKAGWAAGFFQSRGRRRAVLVGGILREVFEKIVHGKAALI